MSINLTTTVTSANIDALTLRWLEETNPLGLLDRYSPDEVLKHIRETSDCLDGSYNDWAVRDGRPIGAVEHFDMLTQHLEENAPMDLNVGR
jgi:hypothetical protein